jgi:hypothetical protein
MITGLKSVPVNATNGLLDRRLHDIGWGLLLMLTGIALRSMPGRYSETAAARTLRCRCQHVFRGPRSHGRTRGS